MLASFSIQFEVSNNILTYPTLKAAHSSETAGVYHAVVTAAHHFSSFSTTTVGAALTTVAMVVDTAVTSF